MERILPRDGNPGADGLARRGRTSLRRNTHGDLKAFGENVRRLRGRGCLPDGPDALQARLVQGGGVFRTHAACVQSRVAHVEIPHAITHEEAGAINVAVIETAFLEPLVVFLKGEVLDRVLQVCE